MAPQLTPVRWWRDDADRYRSRREPPPKRSGFCPSWIPAAERNLEWERMAYADIAPIVPLEWEQISGFDPIADIQMRIPYGAARIMGDPAPYLTALLDDAPSDEDP